MDIIELEAPQGEHFKISKEEIREIRKDHEKEKLFMMTVKIGHDLQDFVFRTAPRHMVFELVQEMKQDEESELQEIICEYAVLYPEDYDFENGVAGASTLIATQIIHLSGMISGQGDQLLHDFRYEMGLMSYQIDCVIHEAFPEYPLEEIARWDMEKAMYYYSRAEWILQNIRGLTINISPGQAELEQNPELAAQLAAQQQPQQQQAQYQQVKSNPQSDFSEYQAINPEELLKKDKAEMTEEEKQIAENYVMSMMQEESDKYGYGKVAPVSKEMPGALPELKFFEGDFELGRE